MVAIHFMHYNFARIHKTLRIAPAMAAGSPTGSGPFRTSLRLRAKRKIAAMSDAERYQKEFDAILRDTEDKAKRAEYLQGVDRLEQLFARADQLGISQAESWRIIEKTPADPKAGVLALIEEIKKLST